MFIRIEMSMRAFLLFLLVSACATKKTNGPGELSPDSSGFFDKFPNISNLPILPSSPDIARFKTISFLNLKTWQCIADEAKALGQFCSQSEDQKFVFKDLGYGIYNVVNRVNGKCLQLAKPSSAEGVLAVFEPCSPNNKYQELKIAKSNLDPLAGKLLFLMTNKCLAASELSLESATLLKQETCYDGKQQDFYFLDRSKAQKTLPRIVWTFWDSGESKMPAFYRANLIRWRTVLQGSKNPSKNWEIHVINNIKGDPNYIANFVSVEQLPTVEFLQSKISPTEKLNANVVFSDFVRLELLNELGGVWMDPSIMLHRSLNEVANILETANSFSILGYTSYSQATKFLRYEDSLENFFFMAYPKSELLGEWRKTFHRYWDEKQASMLIENHPMFNGSEGQKIDVFNYGNLRQYLNQHLSLKHVLTLNPELRGQILILGGTLLHDKGPFSLLTLVGWQDQALLDLKGDRMDAVFHAMRGVLISKFPSESSKNIRAKITDPAYFFRRDNIFGHLNAEPFEH